MKYRVKLTGYEVRIIEAESSDEAEDIAARGHTFEVLDDIQVSAYDGNLEADNV